MNKKSQFKLTHFALALCLAILGIFLLTSTSSAYNPYSNTSALFQRGPKPNNLSLEFVLATEQTKDETSKELDGMYNKFDTSLLYALSHKEHLRFFISHLYITNENKDDSFKTDMAELMYRRNLLNKNEHGVDLDIELKNYYYIDADKRELYGYNGAFIPQVIVNEKFGSGISAELKLRRQFMHRNNPNDGTLSTIDRVYFTPSYFYKRKFIFAAQFKYEHKIRKGKYFSYRYMKNMKKNEEALILHPSVMYFYNRKTLIEFYVETKLRDSKDERELGKIASDERVFGMAMYLTAF